MEFTCIPVIVIICYIIGEILKTLFNKKSKIYKIIPMILTIIGGLLGTTIFYTTPEIIINTNNIWSAITVGMISGASATGANKLIEKIYKKEKK